jgi:flagellar hook-associated protein 3 FlgL
MKISNAYMFNRAVDQMTSVQEKLSKTQAQMAAGKQVLMASDAPDQAASIERYRSLLQRQDSYQSTIESMNARLKTEETALSSVSNMLIRMKELSVQAANDTLGPTDRLALATEMTGLREQILSMANSQDSSGNYIFAGSRVSAPPFVALDGQSPSYQGDQSRMPVPVGDQRSVMLNRPGAEVFARVVRTDDKGVRSGIGFFEVLDQAIAAVKSSDRTGMQRGMGELDALLSNISLAQAQVGTDQNVLQAQQDIVSDTTLTLKNVLSGIEDLDYAEAVAKLNQQTLALQAAQSSFAKVSQLNLFNYIN